MNGDIMCDVNNLLRAKWSFCSVCVCVRLIGNILLYPNLDFNEQREKRGGK